MSIGQPQSPERDRLELLHRLLAEKRLLGATPDVVRKRDPLSLSPLSSAQERLWFADELTPGSALNNVAETYRLLGVLDAPALEQALAELVRRHEALRTRYPASGGRPVPAVDPPGSVPLPLEDLQRLPERAREFAIARRVDAEARAPFDLAAGPVLRARLLRLGPQDHVLVLVVHHIAADGWSMGIIFRELTELYGAYARGEASPLPEPSLQYADYAAWQRERQGGQACEQNLTYWRERLDGLSALALPTDRPRPPVPSGRGAKLSIRLPVELTEAIVRLAHAEGATLYMVLLAAFQVLLGRYAGREDVAVGTPVAGRTHAELEGLVGCFVNTLVLRTDLAGDPTFRELVRRAREVCLGAYAHQDLPFEKLVEELAPDRDPSRHPLVQVLFRLENMPMVPLALPGVQVRSVPFDAGTAKFDLFMIGWQDENGLLLEFEYATDLFDARSIEQLASRLETLLTDAFGNPERRLSQLASIGPAEGAVLPDPGALLARPVYAGVWEAFAGWAARSPGAAAASRGEESWSYGALAARAGALLGLLQGRGMGRGDAVGVTGPRGLDLVAGCLAVLAGGGVLVPVDPRLPAARKGLMLAEAGVRLVLEAGAAAAGGGWVPAGVGVVAAGDGASVLAGAAVAVGPDDAAYVFFTSGTTGTPKAVRGSHGGLGHFLDWQRRAFAVGPGDRCAQLTGLSFDVVLRDLFLPLTSGATLCLPDEAAAAGDGVLGWLGRERVTLLHAVPALAQAWLAGEAAPRPSALRCAFFAGEPLTDRLVGAWRAAFPGARVVNLYGPTETTLAKCWYEVPAEPVPGAQPVGHPLPHAQALVVAPGPRLCAPGEPGEVVIRTPFRSLGYAGVPGRGFVPNPFTADPDDLVYRTGDVGRYRADGALELLGRLDDQVKIRGVRVEPGEVQAALARHPALAAAAVVVRPGADGQHALVAYVVAAAGPAPAAADLRAHLLALLPEPMVPATFVALDRLPLTPNGKLDRRALPAPDLRPDLARPYLPPRSPTEETVAGIWAELLRVDRVGVHDDFFQLGGHSLMAARVVARVRQAVGVNLPLRALFEASTVAGVSEAIEALRLGRLVTGGATNRDDPGGTARSEISL